MAGRDLSRSGLAACLTLAGLAVLVPVTLAPAKHEQKRRGQLTAARDLGATTPTTEISFALALKINERRLAHDTAATGVPSQLSPAALGHRYGLPLAAERKIEQELAAHRIAVTAVYPQRSEIDARASVSTLDRYFHVRYRDYLDASGVRFHAPTRAPLLPGTLRRWVTAVVGLSTRPVTQPADVRQGALVPDDAALAYQVTPLLNQKIDGRGQTIAIMSFSRFDDPDVTYYRRFFGVRGPKPSHIRIGTGASGGSDVTEDNLDVQVISAIAPHAQIVNYEAPNTGAGELALFNRIVAGKAKIASYSWGTCDSQIPVAFRHLIERTAQMARLRGITIFVASGDLGAYDCQQADFAAHRLTVDFPSDSPNVISVGGTLLSVNADGSYLGESGWEDPFTNGGGGGGINSFDPAPAWQRAHTIGDGVHRVVPDVSAAASPGSSWFVRDGGKAQRSRPDWWPISGTSAAAPFWAASMLLAEQLAQRSGIGNTCFLAPILYQLAYTPQPYPPFHDVTSGGNRYYDAKPGWDYATGLGSPNVDNLARDLLAYQRTHHNCD
jgi:subtilase family serine protease